MGSQRDAISKLACYDDLADLTLTFGAAFNLVSAAVDVTNKYALGFAIETSRVLNASDVVNYSFEESDDGSTNWTAVPDEGSLPSRRQSPDNKLVIAANGFLQMIGVFSTKNFVRVRVQGQADTSDITLTLRPIALSELQEFTDWDPELVPGDGLP